VTDGFVAVPIGFDLMTVLIEFAATIAVGKSIGVMILE
jgi:hypothetical protein